MAGDRGRVQGAVQGGMQLWKTLWIVVLATMQVRGREPLRLGIACGYLARLWTVVWTMWKEQLRANAC